MKESRPTTTAPQIVAAALDGGNRAALRCIEMRIAAVAAVVVAAVVVAPAHAAAPQDPALAMLPTTSAHAPGAPDADAVDDVVRAILASMPGVAAQAREITLAHLKSASALGLACDPTAESSDACLVELGPLCGADVVVATAVSKKTIDLRIALVEAGAVRKQSLPWSADGAALRRALATMLAPSSVGSLVIEADAGAAVLVDGIAMGKAPLDEAVTALAPGVHSVEVRKEGFVTQHTKTQVRAGEQTRLIISLVVKKAAPRKPPADEPFLPRALVVVGGGVGAVGVVAGAVGGVILGGLVTAKSRLARADDDYRAGLIDLNKPDERRSVVEANAAVADAQQSFDTFGPLLYAGAGAVVVGAAVAVVGLAIAPPPPPAEPSSAELAAP